MHFHCDRCQAHDMAPMADAVQSGKVKAPKDWVTIWIDDPTGVSRHLCPDCNTKFQNFMVKQ